ncbi:TetR family transcriptional regulator [Cellulomonas fengjieae]|uniref:TetR family transcriptional regulator n=1 Tax=Cellulomonas fengjieae TaxID=2819978 RepID=A0ABS3SJ51_9CELL|nr:TetR family transcriptional regulator [Cellulomonas fengjieae]MBO3085781.1 TetR family transcriptional regulator [Cellulomonas fengjieae]MBO3102891.1 TetR family transcriptional regulator [Cellulomonas fengjieae]QVI67515.1 TetR family transcriptional regulator [Cellulomonas fengjieae]
MRDDGAQTRAKIRDAAHIEFAAHGLAGARVDRIAKAAGANVQRIYAYYSDKHGLFTACVLDAVADLDRAIGDDVDDVVTLAARMFDHISADAHNLRILTWARLEIEDDLRTIIAASERDPLRRVRELTQAGRIDPRWAPQDVFALLISFCEAWHVVPIPTEPTAADHARRRELVLRLAAHLVPDASV